MKFVPAVAYMLCLALPGSFLAVLCATFFAPLYRFQEYFLSYRIASLLDEDAGVNALGHAVDEHDDGKGVGGDGVVGGDEAGEAEAGPGEDEGPRRLQEEAEVGAVRAQPPLPAGVRFNRLFSSQNQTQVISTGF